MGGTPALVFSGRPRPRNYAANAYPFRAESHFLYLAGLPSPGAALLVDGAVTTLFVQRPAHDDALWRGPAPTLAEYKHLSLADDVRFSDELAPPAGCATLPVHDGATATWQSKLLGRTIAAGSGAHVSGSDARLADAMIALRLRHDAAALAEMRDAVAISARAHRACARCVRPGVRESEVRAALEAELTAAGACPAYGSIVTRRGEVLHMEDSSGVLAPGDLLLVDAGAEGPGGFASDVTRVYPASGKLSATQRAIYDVVLASNRAAIALVRPGIGYRQVHAAAMRTFVDGLVSLGILEGAVDGLVERNVGALFFPHGVGHLLGLDVHDMEDLGDRAGYAPGRTRSERFGEAYLRLDRDLEPGMVVTIEPGFYQVPAILADSKLAGAAGGDLKRAALARFSDVRGLRLEDDVLCTESGHEVLTAAIPIAPDAVEAWMRA